MSKNPQPRCAGIPEKTIYKRLSPKEELLKKGAIKNNEHQIK